MFLRDKRTLCFAFIGFIIISFGLVCNAYADTIVKIAHINAGDEAVLDDGRLLHLQGVKAPRAGSGILSEQSIALLKILTDHATIFLDNPLTDRYGRLSAQVYLLPPHGKKIWLQQVMLRHGMVFVYPPTGTEDRIEDLLEAEMDAYSKHRGIWGDPTYADTPARQAQDLYGHFAFVTGKIVKAERIKNIVYLNFGSDRRTDFTIGIAAHYLKAFRQAGIEPFAYQGSSVRVRGWIKRDPGPVIDVTSPSQIQILEQH